MVFNLLTSWMFPVYFSVIPAKNLMGSVFLSLRKALLATLGTHLGHFAYYTTSDAHCINSTSVRRCSVGEWVEGVVIEAGMVIIALF